MEVEACAVCRTDLHVVDGELADLKLPLIPGHQIVGRDVATGRRVGIPWLAWTCGVCRYCREGRENLCDRALFTGYTRDGGYAEYAVADARYCFDIPESYSAAEAAPLLCAGLIGYRAYRFLGVPRVPRGSSEGIGPRAPRNSEELRGTEELAKRIAFYGFGSAAQILAQIAVSDGREVYAFTREGDESAQELARSVGAVWAGSGAAPVEMDAAIIFAPAGELVVSALQAVRKGGVVVCAGIHMSDIPSFSYSLLWGERVIRSVANLQREDGVALFERLRTLRIVTKRTAFALEDANEALASLRSGELTGTAVLEIKR